jgi:HAMP domain-containing protein
LVGNSIDWPIEQSCTSKRPEITSHGPNHGAVRLEKSGVPGGFAYSSCMSDGQSVPTPNAPPVATNASADAQREATHFSTRYPWRFAIITGLVTALLFACFSWFWSNKLYERLAALTRQDSDGRGSVTVLAPQPWHQQSLQMRAFYSSLPAGTDEAWIVVRSPDGEYFNETSLSGSFQAPSAWEKLVPRLTRLPSISKSVRLGQLN